MNVARAITNLALRVATVAVISAVTFLTLLALHLFGVPLQTHPVIQVLGVACTVSWRLYRGSTPMKEIERFLDFGGPGGGIGLRSNNRVWTPPSRGDR
jgi:hypothetical protein